MQHAFNYALSGNLLVGLKLTGMADILVQNIGSTEQFA